MRKLEESVRLPSYPHRSEAQSRTGPEIDYTFQDSGLKWTCNAASIFPLGSAEHASTQCHSRLEFSSANRLWSLIRLKQEEEIGNLSNRRLLPFGISLLNKTSHVVFASGSLIVATITSQNASVLTEGQGSFVLGIQVFGPN